MQCAVLRSVSSTTGPETFLNDGRFNQIQRQVTYHKLDPRTTPPPPNDSASNRVRQKSSPVVSCPKRLRDAGSDVVYEVYYEPMGCTSGCDGMHCTELAYAAGCAVLSACMRRQSQQ
eukprot:2315164-Rhodomonas_salina.3